MLGELSRQYDRAAYLRSLAARRWDAVARPRTFRGDDARLERINRLQPEMARLERDEIRDRVASWKAGVSRVDPDPDAILEPAFALLREVSKRVTGQFHYDEQILAGLALARGGIAEMATGEGKTLAISLPAFIHGLNGKGVHVITVNSYLAERDFNFSRPIFEYLGLSIGLLPEGADIEAKRAAYAKDVTYGVGYEFGFDYMRDHLAQMRMPRPTPGEGLRLAILGLERRPADLRQRGLPFAIIDEVDSVLIDEAGSPLLISEQRSNQREMTEAFHAARDVAGRLIENADFVVDRAKRQIRLTKSGQQEIFRDSREIPWSQLARPWTSYLLNALRAEHLFERDNHYVVLDEEVVIVDEFTGRRFKDRSWREGQHQAVEAKEGVPVKPEHDSAASITRQRFFAQYDQICGLTGTASESAGEFWHFFKMPVATIPLHEPCCRVIHPDRVFQTRDAMHAAVLEDVAKRHATRQPILVGTRTIKVSEIISGLLEQQGIPHRVLSAKQDADEGALIAQAGQAGSIVVATNMAGRGAHIDLSPAAENAGGLHVMVVERHESARIDRQLVGRGARQGQPGSAQVFVSADDFIIQTYASEVGDALRSAPADAKGELPPRFKKHFDRVQAQVERRRYEGRLRMAAHDEWMEDTKTTLSS